MQGQRGLSTNSSEYNAQDFMISQMLWRIATAEPVRVVAVSGSGVSPVGFVDVQPLVNLVTGEQKAQEQSVLFKLPYLRIQGGKNALVVDHDIAFRRGVQEASKIEAVAFAHGTG